MATPFLALESASFVLPDGRHLFSGITEQLDQRHTGLVGRNGIGKSILATVLAGQREPTSGRCLRQGRVRYLAQQTGVPSGARVAALAGLQAAFDALARIEAGGCDPADFDLLADRWDLRQHFQAALVRAGLAHVDPDTPAGTLSGGEAMRVALTGAMLSDADFLILDEPSNHLDRPHRQALIAQLAEWPRGLLVISHDRRLLDTMERILELSSQGLHSYGGNYRFYAQAKAQEQLAAAQRLEHLKLEQKRQAQQMRDQQERQARRLARGSRQAKEANQAKILLDRQKERSEASTGRLRQQHAAARAQAAQEVRSALQQVEQGAAIVLQAVAPTAAHARRVIALEEVQLPFVRGATRDISLVIGGQQRVGVIGPNGCGKSTLLKVVAGLLPAAGGVCRVTPAVTYLDQQVATLEPECPVLPQFLAANPTLTEGEMRTRLAQLGLDAARLATPCGALSGGERLKAALAAVLYADPPPQLLLLDEPSNHLDLPSLQALEDMLRHYRGALMVVSHDEAFLEALGLTDRLEAGPEGWRLEPW